MSVVNFKEKQYEFSWYKIAIFAIFCPILAILVIELLSFFWVVTYPPIIIPICNILSFLTGENFTYYYTASGYILNIPNPETAPILFVSACVGIEAYGIYAGVSLMTPHNNIKTQGKNIYLRKVGTLILACLLIYLANIVRSVVTLYFYYKGVPFSPMHENIGYITTFFAVFSFYTISYFWLPEFSLFVIWMKERIKDKIAEIRSEKEERDEEDIKIKQKEVKKIFLLVFWIIVAVIISLIMVYIIFF